ncbi:MAG TPA: hypothetical protein VFS56_00555, partial [Gemmatimonadaceae bacterium]|nr:hypothetical protein [Gemmatimonadaceae bacterium]
MSFLLTRLCLGAVGVTTLYYHQPSDTPSRIAFASRRDGNWEIYVTDAGGRTQTRLTRRREQDRFPLWSPDRSKIAFGLQLSTARFETWELWVMDADGTNARPLCSKLEAKGFREWSPDGTRIALTSNRDGDLEIYTVRADGTGLSRLTN